MKQTPDLTLPNPSVKIPIKKDTTVAYLRHLFQTSRNGPLLINRNISEGKFINSHISYSDMPVKKTPGNCYEELIVYLPKNPLNEHVNKFTFIRSVDAEQINDYLEAKFELFFRSVIIAGDSMGIQKKDLIEAFVMGTKIPFDEKIIERLKKNDYRYRVKIYNFLIQSLKSIGLQ